MIGLGLIVVAVVVVVLGRAAPAARRAISSGGGPAPTGTGSVTASPEQGQPRATEDLPTAVERWAHAGLISPEQGSAIVAAEAARAATPADAASEPGSRWVAPTVQVSGRIPLYAEGLGYLGGMLALGGLGMVVGRYWEDLSAPARFAVAAVVAVLAALGGSTVAEGRDPALDRLRGVLLVASSAGVGLAVGVLADDVTDSTVTVAQVASGAVGLYGLLLWQGRSRPLQQLTAVAAGLVFVGTTGYGLGDELASGIALWVAGGAVTVIGARRLVGDPLVTQATGPLAMMVGSISASQDAFAPGATMGVVAAVGVVALAVVPGLAEEQDLVPFGALGALLSLQWLPSTLGYFSEGAGAITGVGAMVAGAGVIAAANRHLVRAETTLSIVGGAGLFGGAAFVAQQSTSAAVVLGLVASVVLLAVGARPGQLVLSFLGSFGLLVYVPWAVGWFFPGEDVAALVVIVTGGLILALAVMLTRRTMRSTGEGTPAPPSP